MFKENVFPCPFFNQSDHQCIVHLPVFSQCMHTYCIYIYIYTCTTIPGRCAAPHSEAQRCHTAVQRMREPLAATWTQLWAKRQLWALRKMESNLDSLSLTMRRAACNYMV